MRLAKARRCGAHIWLLGVHGDQRAEAICTTATTLYDVARSRCDDHSIKGALSVNSDRSIHDQQAVETVRNCIRTGDIDQLRIGSFGNGWCDPVSGVVRTVFQTL